MSENLENMNREELLREYKRNKKKIIENNEKIKLLKKQLAESKS